MHPAALFVLCVVCLQLCTAPCAVADSPSGGVAWLTARTKAILAGCQLPGVNGTSIYTPDATHAYGAQWTRDFAYMVMSTPHLLNATAAAAAVRYTFGGQRGDGCMPDRVQADGMAVYSPGSNAAPFADHAWDNGPFAALLLSAAALSYNDASLFCDLEPGARRGLEFLNRSAATGLVYNDDASPNCTYGFTDTVAKTGDLLFTSLLLFDASNRMAAAASAFGCGNVTWYRAQAGAVAAGVEVLKDADTPFWLAASASNALPDVWGSLYLVSLGLSTAARRQAVVAAVVANGAAVLRDGQVRHLPYPRYVSRSVGCPGGCPWLPVVASPVDSRRTWQRCFTGACSAAGTYQNGGYWATPLTYLSSACMATNHSAFATAVLANATASFRTDGSPPGVYEWLDTGHPATGQGVLNYTASATNVVKAWQTLGVVAS